jgi:catechol 2,3-dioxygenase-like lactoylglutathione lyase family enzyme
MSIELNHTIVPCLDEPGKDKTISAKFYARIFGFDYVGAVAHFVAVKVNQSLTLDFDNANGFGMHHYAFKVSEPEFDEIFGRVKSEGLAYGSGPRSLDDMSINHREGGRGVYFVDPNMHILEILTV